ncbi:hypothetical protein, partial [Pediococcus acidilactici]|uniref:hypothetical protein n=1 Tax=Pediococcus acidilactici TaxID=1254 RepID=UPI00197DDD19
SHIKTHRRGKGGTPCLFYYDIINQNKIKQRERELNARYHYRSFNIFRAILFSIFWRSGVF